MATWDVHAHRTLTRSPTPDAMAQVAGAAFTAVIQVGAIAAVLIFFAARAPALDRHSGADTSAIDELRERIASYQAQHARIPTVQHRTVASPT